MAPQTKGIIMFGMDAMKATAAAYVINNYFDGDINNVKTLKAIMEMRLNEKEPGDYGYKSYKSAVRLLEDFFEKC